MPTRALSAPCAEAWASPLARSKWIEGKLIYQTAPMGRSFFARPYRIQDDTFIVPAGGELRERVPRPLPPNHIKLG